MESIYVVTGTSQDSEHDTILGAYCEKSTALKFIKEYKQNYKSYISLRDKIDSYEINIVKDKPCMPSFYSEDIINEFNNKLQIYIKSLEDIKNKEEEIKKEICGDQINLYNKFEELDNSGRLVEINSISINKIKLDKELEITY